MSCKNGESPIAAAVFLTPLAPSLSTPRKTRSILFSPSPPCRTAGRVRVPGGEAPDGGSIGQGRQCGEGGHRCCPTRPTRTPARTLHRTGTSYHLVITIINISFCEVRHRGALDHVCPWYQRPFLPLQLLHEAWCLLLFHHGNVQEFGVLVSGVGEVEAGEWEAHAQLSGYRADAPQVRLIHFSP